MGPIRRTLLRAFMGKSISERILSIVPAATQYAPPKKGTREFLRAYSEMPWLRAVTARVSTAVASSQWSLLVGRTTRARSILRLKHLQRMNDIKAREKEIKRLKDSNEIEEITDHPLLDALDNGNGQLDGRTVFQLTQSYLDLVGDTLWLIERNGAQMPIAFWPCPPHWIEELSTVKTPAFKLNIGGTPFSFPQEETIWFANPDPFNPYGRGSGVAQSLGDELELDEYAARHIKTFFYNRARPDILVTGDFGRDEGKRLEEAWLQKLQGFWKQFKPHFLSGVDVKVTELSQSFEAMQLVPLRKQERDTIINVFGVPPETLGIIENSNRATIDAADYLFSRGVVLPRLEALRAVLQRVLVPQYDENLILEFDSPVAEDQEFLLRAATAAPYTLLANEWRELQGQPARDDGDVFLVPFSVVPTSSLSSMGLENEPEPPAEPDVDDDTGVVEEALPEAIEKRRKLAEVLASGVPSPELIGDDLLGDPIIDLLVVDEMVRAGGNGGGSQPDDTQEEAHNRPPLAHCPPPIQTKPKDGSRFITSSEIEAVIKSLNHEDLFSEMEPVYQTSIEFFGQAVIDEVGAGIAFNLVDPAVVEFLEAKAAAKVVRITENSRKALRSLIVSGTEEGLDINGLSKLIQDNLDERIFPPSRALTIARTETVGAANFGALEGMDQAAVERKGWLSARDSRVRETHQPGGGLDGQVVLIHEDFTSPEGGKAQHPGAFGIAGEDINCRCGILPIISDEDHDFIQEGDPEAVEKFKDAKWKAFEASRMPYQRQMKRAVKRGFSTQKKAVLSALKEIIER